MKNHLIKNLFSIALACLFLFGSCSSKVYNITGVYDNKKLLKRPHLMTKFGIM